MIDKVDSRMGSPKETTGMATAMMVGALVAPCKAKALRMNPMNKLPQSPRKTVAGLKLKRRNPSTAPLSASAISDTRADCVTSETTNTTSVENSAEPAASPSSPSIRLKALVIASTHSTVKGSPTNQG